MAKKRSNFISTLILIIRPILFIGLCVYAVLNVYGYRFDTQDRAFKKTGVMDISTFPENAEIILNGNSFSGKTPLIISALDVGYYDITLRVPGFISFQKKYQVEDQFVSLIRNIFLLPESPEHFLSIDQYPIDKYFDTLDFVIFPQKDTARFFIYSKTDNRSLTLEAPFSDLVQNVLQRGSDHLVFATSNTLYDFNISTKRIERLLPFRAFKKVLTSSSNPDVVFYITDDGTFFEYRILSGKIEPLLYNISSAGLSGETLHYCDAVLNRSYSIAVSDLEQNGNLGSIRDSENFCPLERIFEVSGHTVAVVGSDLYVDEVRISRSVSHMELSRSGHGIVYTTGSGLYLFDFSSKKATLVTRFDDTIAAVSQALDEQHFFVASGRTLFFCDTFNEYCQRFVSLPQNPTWIWFDTDHLALLFENEGRLYRADFSFWEKNGWF